MARMLDNMTVSRNEMFKGAARVVISDPDVLTSFPGRMESVINPAVPISGDAYALASGWVDLGPTNTDGVTIGRTADLSDGIEVDQRNANLDEGEPDSWEMTAEMTLLHTTLDNFNYAWAAGSSRAHAAGAQVAQHSLTLDAPTTFTERMLACIQQDQKRDQMRVIVFRKAVPQADSEMVMTKTDPSELPCNFTLRIDPSIAEGYGEFGVIYEEDALGE